MLSWNDAVISHRGGPACTFAWASGAGVGAGGAACAAARSGAGAGPRPGPMYIPILTPMARSSRGTTTTLVTRLMGRFWGLRLAVAMGAPRVSLAGRAPNDGV